MVSGCRLDVVRSLRWMIRRLSSLETPAGLSKVWKESALVQEYAQKPLRPLTLGNMLKMGREQNLDATALYVHQELPTRLARRVAAIQKLPYIVGVNPHIEKVGELYRTSFHKVIQFPEPKSPETRDQFVDLLDQLTHSHQNVIPNLAQGFMESGRYMAKHDATAFLDQMIHARIGIRVIAEHFLNLDEHKDNWIGIVNTKTHPTLIIENICKHVQELCEFNYGSSPSYEIVGHKETEFPYVPVHLEYIFMELIKNAMRATVECSIKTNRLDHPPVEICITKSQSDVTVRIRDNGGGIPTHDLERVWDYSYTTVPQTEVDDDFFTVQSRMSMQQGVGGPIAGLGFGLPMSRIYAKYFGGSLEFRSLVGHGVDMYVRLPNIETVSQSIHI
ncbi:branched-chain alpha-ketoacid dehydrogenase [Gorgonomyces haynaldii]|nr:branched-chain alpha-ketoacid dehydrogenase [Gorgonomyces haynaldii]